MKVISESIISIEESYYLNKYLVLIPVGVLSPKAAANAASEANASPENAFEDEPKPK